MNRIVRLAAFMALALFMGFYSRPALAQNYSNEIDVLGFKFVVKDGSVVVEDDKLTLKGTGSIDLSPALGDGAVITVDQMSIDHESTVKMKGIATPEIHIGPLRATIAPDDIVLEKVLADGANPYINLNVNLNLDLAGESVLAATVIPITKDGIQDTTIHLIPPEGEDAFLKKEFQGTKLTIASIDIPIVDKAVQSVNFNGSLDLFGTELAVENLIIGADGEVSGTVKAKQGTTIRTGAVDVGISGAVDFSTASGGFKADIEQLTVKIGSLIPGAEGEISFSPISIDENGFSASVATRQKIDIYGVGLLLDNVQIDAERRDAGMYMNMVMDGAVEIDELGLNVAFSGLAIDSDGNVKGDLTLPEPQEFTMFGVGFMIDGVTIALKDGSLVVGASGEFQLGNDKLRFTSLTIAESKVDARFDVSKDKPFALSWSRFLKLNQLQVDQNVLTLGGSVDIPAPFDYTFSFEDVKFDDAGDVLKAVDKADVEGAVQEAAQAAARPWDDLDDPDLVLLENTNKESIDVAGFSFYIDAIAIPNPLKVAKSKAVPDTLLDLYGHSKIPLMGGKHLDIVLDKLEVTKEGLKDVDISIPPLEGQDNIFKFGVPGWAQLTVSSATMSFKEGAFSSFGFNGFAEVAGQAFEIVKLDYGVGGEWDGYLRPQGSPEINLAGVALRFEGDIEFKIASEPSVFELTMSDLALDMSGLVGAPVQIQISKLKIANGDVEAEVDMSESLTLGGFQLSLTKATLISKAPSVGGKRQFEAKLDGALNVAAPSMKLEFRNFYISSGGTVGGDLILPAPQQFEMFGFRVTIKSLKILKQTAGWEVGVGGTLAFGSYSADVSGITIKNGKVQANFTFAEADALTLPLCPFIKLTKVVLNDEGTELEGFVTLPQPIGGRLDVQNLKLDANGRPIDGKVNLTREIVIGFGEFRIALTRLDLDVKNLYMVMDGEIRLPSDMIAEPFAFKNMGLSLAGSGKMDTANSNFGNVGSVQDNKHGLPLQITDISMGQRNGEFFLLLQGSLSVMKGASGNASGFTLNFSDFAIYQDLDFSFGSITGGIMIAGFGVEVKKLDFGDSYTSFTGGMTLPALGGIMVEDLKVYKDGRVEISGIRVFIDYSAYQIDVYLSYKDSILKAAGNVVMVNKQLAVKGEFGPGYFSLDLDVGGLQIQLFPGVFLDSIGGGVTYKDNPFWMEFRIRCGIAFGDASTLYGKFQFAVTTDGIIRINGSLTAFTMFPVADVEIILDIPRATLTGKAKLNITVGGPIIGLKDIQVEIYAGGDKFYIKGTGKIVVFYFLEIGSASVYIGDQGFSLSARASMDLAGIVTASFDFGFSVSTSLVLDGHFNGRVSIDLKIAYAGAYLNAKIHAELKNPGNSYFSGSAGLRVCVTVACASADLGVRVDTGGVHAWLDW